MADHSDIRREHLRQLLDNPLFIRLMDALTVATQITDEKGTILHFSRTSYEMYDMDPSGSVVGKNVREIFKSADEGALEALRTKKVITINSRAHSGVEGLCKRTPFMDSRGEAFCCLSEDFTTTHSEPRNQELLQRIEQLRNILAQQPAQRDLYSFDAIIGDSPVMQHVKKRGLLFARQQQPILLTGENGTGKELFAQAIHNAGPRAQRAFIPVNCAALPHDLAEAELFGYEEGAFTGAKKGGQKGLFELADKGTIFLDEISELPLSLQAKLLRALESREIQKIGMGKKLFSDFRLIAATNRKLPDMVKAGQFREDLYFRLGILDLHLPPLRERREDIPQLIPQLIQQICPPQAALNFRVSPEVLNLFMSYNWPGNVRELKNTLTYAYCCMENAGENELDPSYLPERLALELAAESQVAPPPAPPPVSLRKLAAETEKNGILAALEKAGYNKSKTARALGISRNTLYLKMKAYGIPMEG